MGQPRPLFYFRSFHTFHILLKKTVSVSGIRTGIVGKEGEHADHLTTTTALLPTKLVMMVRVSISSATYS